MLSRRYAEDEDKPAWERPAIASFCVGVWGAARRKVRLDQVNVEFRVTAVDQDPGKKSPIKAREIFTMSHQKHAKKQKNVWSPLYNIPLTYQKIYQIS